MGKIITDTIFDFYQYNISEKDDIFNFILEKRKSGEGVHAGLPEQFFLYHISPELFANFNYNNKQSLVQFRNFITSYGNNLKLLGGCNLKASEQELYQYSRYYGIKLCDSTEKVIGQFDINKYNRTITYDPLIPNFNGERDLCKFASNAYYTTLTFEEIALKQIELSRVYQIHTDDSINIKDIAKGTEKIYKRVSQTEFMNYIKNC